MATNVKRVVVPLNDSFPDVNMYLIHGTELNLVDAGMSGENCWEILVKRIQETGFRLEELSNVFVTHWHIDHVGLLPQIAKYTDAKIWIPASSEIWFKSPDESLDMELKFIIDFCRNIGFANGSELLIEHHIRRLNKERVSLPPDRYQCYSPQDTLAISDDIWEILHTPGHCQDHYCFYNPKTKELFSGDMLLPLTPMPLLSPNSLGSSERFLALPALMDSYQKLLKIDISKIYPGHGEITMDKNELIINQLERINRRQSECQNLLDQGVDQVLELYQKMYGAKAELFNWGGFCMIMGYLDLISQSNQSYSIPFLSKLN